MSSVRYLAAHCVRGRAGGATQSELARTLGHVLPEHAHQAQAHHHQDEHRDHPRHQEEREVDAIARAAIILQTADTQRPLPGDTLRSLLQPFFEIGWDAGRCSDEDVVAELILAEVDAAKHAVRGTFRTRHLS